MRQWVMAALAAAAISLPARAMAASGPRAFVAWLYAQYPTARSEHGFDALGSSMGRIFHPSLIALIKEDQRLAGGEVGALDGDPICDCQDDSALSFTITAVRATDPTRAIATVVRHDLDSRDDAETITLDLAMTDGHWRVYDVETKDTPSLRAYLIKSNREAREAR